MEPTPELIDAIYREKVERARRMRPEEKFWAGVELFDYACDISRAGIRSQFPGYSVLEVEDELTKRLRVREELEKQS